MSPSNGPDVGRAGPWRRILLAIGALAAAGLHVRVLVFVPALLKGESAIADRLPQAAQDFQTWAKNTLGVDVSTTSIQSGGAEASSSLLASADSPVSTLIGFTATLIGG